MPRKMCTWDRAGKQFRFILLLLGMVVAVASFAIAQLPTGTILGQVRDGTGALVPGVMLTAMNTETGLTRETLSSENGSYRIPALPVGPYEVRAALPGFQTAVRSGLTLTVDQEAIVNFTLQVGEVAQTVEVSAEAPLVNTTSSSLGGLVNEQIVADLPLNGRNYVDLTFLQPGVTKNENMTSGGTFVGSWFSSNGAPLRSNTYMLDGAVMGNVLGGSASSMANTTLGIEGIREWRVITNTFSAEYGLTMGSQTSIVTKSGTNSYHGSLFEYLRNSALDARNFFDYKTPETPNRLPSFKRNNFGGSIGGPIKTNKLFFFGTYEALRERLGVYAKPVPVVPAACRTEPLPAGCRFDGGTTIYPTIKPLLAVLPEPNLPGDLYTFSFNQPTEEDYGQGRIDFTASDSDTLFGRYTHDETRQLKLLTYPGFATDRYSKNQYITVSESHVFSPTLLNTIRFSFSNTQLNLTSPTDLHGPEYDFVTGNGVGTIIGVFEEFGPRLSAPLIQNQKVLSWSDDMYYTAGSHSLKFGTLINHYEPHYRLGALSKGLTLFPTLTHFLRGTPAFYAARAPGSILDSDWRYNTLGFYLQDDWRVNSNLTLNMGLRYEFLTLPNEINGHGSSIRNMLVDALPTCADPACLQADDPGRLFENPSLHNFGPRLGFAWDVSGDGKTAVRGGGAILYDVATFGSATLGLGWPYSSTARGGGSFDLPWVFPSGPGGRSAGGVDYNLGQPYSVQYNLSVERELPWNLATTVSYAGTRGIHLYRRNEGNPAIPMGTPGVDANGNQVCLDQGTPTFTFTGAKCWLGGEARVNPNWAQASRLYADSNSFYNALEFQVRKRLSNGLQFQSAYTFSKAIDETQGIIDAENTTSHFLASDPFNRLRDRGPSSFDVTHNWSVNTIYRLPDLYTSGGGLGGFLNGWWMSGILRVRSGYPFTPVLGDNRSRSNVDGGTNGLDRPDLVPGIKTSDITSGVSSGCDIIPAGTPVGTPNLWFDPCAFTLPAEGFLGTAGRNSVRGPGLTNLDFSLAKDTPLGFLGESGKLEFRAEFFNILNHPNFATPEVGVADPPKAAQVFPGSADEFDSNGNLIPQLRSDSVGRILRTSTTSRQLQFSLKLLF